MMHVDEDQTEVHGLDTPFILGDGTLMQHPLDPLGPAKHLINCTCSTLLRIDWPGLRRDGLV